MREIKESRALQFYGAVLSLTHILTIFQWFFDNRFALNILERFYPACWPFFESCYKWRPFDKTFIQIYFYSYLIVSFVAFFLFLFKKNSPKPALLFLTIALTLKSLVSISDYRFMGNFHYMCYLVHLAYLFFPRKKQLIPLLIVSFYVGASLVKFNSQWITGEALLKPTFISGNFLKLACLYVIILELLLTPFLIYGTRKLSYAIFFQLIIFHLFSWHIVGYLYPMMMLLLISIFPVLWLAREWNKLDFRLSKILQSKSTVIFLGIFYLAQTGPLWFKGDSAQTGEGRILSLNMLDAKVKCEEFTYLKYKNKTVEVSEFNFDEGYRIGCDPLLRLSLAKHHCRERSKDPNFLDLDFEFFSQKKSGEPYKKMIQIFDFCKAQPTYTMLQKNSWIIDEPIAYENTITAVRPLPEFSNSPTPLNFEGKGSGWIFAFDKDKNLLWSFYANESFIGVTAKPVEDENFIYFLSGNGRLYSLYKRTGKLRWSAFYNKNLSLDFFLEGEKIHLKTEKEKIEVYKKTGEIISISE
jgi:hypothetical protein